MPDYIVCTRAIKGGSFSSEPGPTRFLKVPVQKNPTPHHAPSRKLKRQSEKGRDRSPHRSCEWMANKPAHERLANLLMDGHSLPIRIVHTEDHTCHRGLFQQPLKLELRPSPQVTGFRDNPRIVAYHHSTGGFIIRETFDDADDRNKIAKTNWSVSQICFVAADVASKDMADSSSNSNSLYRHCVRLTNYHNPYDSVLKLSNIKRVGVAPCAGRVGLPENAPAKAVGVDCGARFLKTHPVTNPVVDPISHGWYFDDPVLLKDLTFTLAGDMDRNVIPTRITIPTLRLSEK